MSNTASNHREEEMKHLQVQRTCEKRDREREEMKSGTLLVLVPVMWARTWKDLDCMLVLQLCRSWSGFRTA